MHRFREHFDSFRAALVTEPRGSEVMVGALLEEPIDPSCAAGVIFFNNAGLLGMCGHGTIGLAVTLAHLDRIRSGKHRLETPVGIVEFEIEGNQVAFENVPSYRFAANVSVEVASLGTIHGDIAWGGNWFFLIGDHSQELKPANVDRLTDYAWRVRQALIAQGITGAGGAEIDHIELFAPSPTSRADCRNFVLCPGKAFDRSPCGTGTSAKLACLAADNKLCEGQVWRQESIIGSLFEGSFRRGAEGRIIPRIAGSAYICAETTLLLDPNDPHRMGFRV
jgi:4-hydroxyproline epimerase